MKNVLVLTYWSYKDALIQTYTLPYVKQIASVCQGQVYLVTLEQRDKRMSENEKIKVTEELRVYNIHPVFLHYHRFGLRAFIGWALDFLRLIFLVFQRRISYIHAWCTPAGAIGYYLSRVCGKKLILDSFEPHAQSMVENGEWKKEGRAFRLLWKLEKKQVNRASWVIGLTDLTPDYILANYGLKVANYFSKPAGVDLNLFTPVTNEENKARKKELGWEEKLVCVYAGKTGGIYLEQEIFDLFKVAITHWGDRFRVLMLTNTPVSRIEFLCKQSGFPVSLIQTKFVPQVEVRYWLAAGDFALNPVKPVPSKRYCTSIKDGEYWACGLPVMITEGISDDSDLIRTTSSGSLIASLDQKGYHQAILEMDHLLHHTSREERAESIRNLAINHRNYEQARRIYQKIYGKS